MTPCELLGFKKGDKFILDIGTPIFPKGASVYLYVDDGTRTPYFTDDSDLDVNASSSSVDCIDLLYITKTNSADSINSKLLAALSIDTSDNTINLPLPVLTVFNKFINSLGAGHDSELSIKKGKYTLYFDNYEFDGDEARIRKVIEMLTELHVKGEWFGKSNLTPKEVSEASYRVANVMMEDRSKS